MCYVGKGKWLLKIDKDPEMLLVNCVIPRELSVSKNISPILNKILESILKCINDIKFIAKCENLFQTFYENKTTDHLIQ